jgi:serine protease Do
LTTTILLGCSRWESTDCEKPMSSAPTGTESRGLGGIILGQVRNLRLGDQAKLVNDPAILAEAAWEIAQDPWQPAVNGEMSRDPQSSGPKVYRLVAPTVVVVKTSTGHGTGSIIDPTGLVLTNYHVIAKGATDAKTGARLATIFVGRLGTDGLMNLDETGLPAVVVSSSKEKDLALLQIKTPSQKFPALKLAKEVPGPQNTCLAIGHPRSGLLWTIREGRIGQIGLWPRDGVQMLGKRVSANSDERQEMKSTMAKSPQMKIVLSNCGINSGDSGGPLVNSDGELIAVTFAMPTDPGTTSFAYHIHLDEVSKFLENRPGSPVAEVVDPWPTGAYQELLDLDGDGTPDALGIGSTKGGKLSGLMIDPRQENKFKTLQDLGDQPRKWRFSLALHFRPPFMAYYDTQGNGGIDLIMTEQEPGGPVHLKRLEKGLWTNEEDRRRPLLDPMLFSERTVQERLGRIAKKLQEK